MKKTLFLALLCCGALLRGAESYKTLSDAARKAEGAKKPEQAIELYIQASKASQKPAEQYQAIQKAARLLIRAKKQAEARKMLLAFAENGANPKINRTMAYLDCLRTTSDADEKIKFMDAAIALAAGSWPEAACYNAKAAVLAAQKKYREAAAEYGKVVGKESFPIVSRTVSYMGLASVAVQQKDFKEAHRCYRCIRDFSKKDPKYVSLDAMKAEAALFNQEGKYAEGAKINLAIAENPKFPAAARAKALGELLETEYNRRNDPVAARKLLKDTEHLKLKYSSRMRRIARDIKYLFDEE